MISVTDVAEAFYANICMKCPIHGICQSEEDGNIEQETACASMVRMERYPTVSEIVHD